MKKLSIQNLILDNSDVENLELIKKIYSSSIDLSEKVKED